MRKRAATVGRRRIARIGVGEVEIPSNLVPSTYLRRLHEAEMRGHGAVIPTGVSSRTEPHDRACFGGDTATGPRGTGR